MAQFTEDEMKELIDSTIESQIDKEIGDLKDKLSDKFGENWEDIEIGENMNVASGGTDNDYSGHNLGDAVSEVENFLEDKVYGDDPMNSAVESAAIESLGIEINEETGELNVSKEDIEDFIKAEVENSFDSNYDTESIIEYEVLFGDTTLDSLESKSNELTETELDSKMNDVVENDSTVETTESLNQTQEQVLTEVTEVLEVADVAEVVEVATT